MLYLSNKILIIYKIFKPHLLKWNIFFYYSSVHVVGGLIKIISNVFMKYIKLKKLLTRVYLIMKSLLPWNIHNSSKNNNTIIISHSISNSIARYISPLVDFLCVHYLAGLPDSIKDGRYFNIFINSQTFEFRNWKFVY